MSKGEGSTEEHVSHPSPEGRMEDDERRKKEQKNTGEQIIEEGC